MDHSSPKSPKVSVVDKFIIEFQKKKFPKERMGPVKTQAATLLSIFPIHY